jgi:putative transposase
MPRTARASVGDVCYHVMNRGNGLAKVFLSDQDYDDFTQLMADARERLPLRILAYCLMPNHFHMVLWPHGDGDLGRWMQWLLTCHVRRFHRVNGTSGHVWQGRFKAFPVQQDAHLLSVMRYVEANPHNAGMVPGADLWHWSSLRGRIRGHGAIAMDESPCPLPADWLGFVNGRIDKTEADTLARCAKRGAPLGEEAWVEETAIRLGLEASLRPIGRPPKVKKEEPEKAKPKRRRTAGKPKK